MRLFASLFLSPILLTAPLIAQFNARTMATDMTGSELILTTTWSLNGETNNPFSKLIRYRAAQLHTLRSVLPERDQATGCLTNLTSLTRPDMSLDGLRYSYTLTWPRTETCIPTVYDTGEIRDDTGALLHSGTGSVALSANGRWARYESSPRYTVVNLENGKSEELNYLVTFGVLPNGRQVADDGTVAIAFRSTLVYVKRPGLEGEYVELPTVFDTTTVADSGDFALLQTRTSAYGPKPVLWWFDLGAKAAVPIATAEEGCYSPSLSTDGTKMVFLSAANWLGLNSSQAVQAFFMDLTTGVLTQVTNGIENVTEALLSGDGGFAFVRYGDGKIVRFNAGSGESAEIVPAVPDPVHAPLVLVPGSRGVLSLPGNRIPTLTVNGMAAKVLEAGDGRVTFIMPQGIANGEHEMLVGFDGSPFQPFKVPVTVRDLNPRVESWNITSKIWHDSDGTAVWEANPARSGEVVEVLLSGLGPVDAEGKTLLAMNWKFRHPGQEQAGPIEVLASRRSPYEGEEGLYRVKLRVPQIHDTGSGALQCFDARDETVASWASLAVTP